jgi:hypothetical protein
MLEYSDLSSGSGFAYARPTLSAAYFAALLTPFTTQRSFQDAWGNPKIPSLRSYDLPVAGQPDWYQFNESGNRTYLNLVGIPLGAIDDTVSSHFVANSVSASFECQSNDLTTDKGYLESVEQLALPMAVQNISVHNMWVGTDVDSYANAFFLHVTSKSWQAFASNASKPLKVFYGSRTFVENADTGYQDNCTGVNETQAC